MAQIFTLSITNNTETVNLLDTTNYQVQDGGFDIGLPSSSKNYTYKRYGPWYEPSSMQYGPRNARITLRIFGATRGAVIANINKIERILHSAEGRSEHDNGARVELKYAWEGATNLTYFEVLGGEVVLPGDALSIAKMFVQKDGVYYIPDIEIQLDLSPFGYGLSLYSTPSTANELAIYSVATGAIQKGGVLVKNPYAGNSNYVQIYGADLPGEQPYITKIIVNGVNATSAYSKWEQFFMGLKVTPYPTTTLFEGEDFDGGTPTPSTRARTGASNNSVAYWTTTTGASPQFSDIFPAIYWSIDPSSSRGTFLAFMQSWNVLYSTHAHFAIGVYDYVQNGYRYISDWVNPRTAAFYHMPIGVVQLPPEDGIIGIASGTYPTGLGIFFSMDSGQSSVETEVDFLSLLPINNGLRTWVQRGVNSVTDLEGDLTDDSWLGINYLKRYDTATVTTPFIGMLDPLKLEPSVDQRIYFDSVGTGVGSVEGPRSYRVQVFAVPTFKLLAY